MSKKKNEEATAQAARSLPALPMKRQRRRVARGSHSWCFRRPPSRKRVETATARFHPEVVSHLAIMVVHELQS